MPLGLEKSQVDGAIAISEIFPVLSHKMDHLEKVETLSGSGIIGVGWSTSGGEAAALLKRKIPGGRRHRECDPGCWRRSRTSASATWSSSSSTPAPAAAWGACSVWRTPTWPRPRIQRLRKYLPVSQNHLGGGPVPPVMEWEESLEFSNVLTLSEDLSEAMRMMVEIDEIVKEFPGLDCGACGAPTCRAFAEDVVRGKQQEDRLHLRVPAADAADGRHPLPDGGRARPLPQGGEVTRHGRAGDWNRRGWLR